MVKIWEFFFFTKLQQVLYDFFPMVTSYSISPIAKTYNYRMSSFRTFFCPHCSGYCTFWVHHEKSLDPAFFKVYIDHLFVNLESGKINYYFEIKSGKSL